MAGKRSYGDPCGIARALDVVGERWALLVVRELVLGPKRFTDLRAHLPGIATDVLSQRLRQLEHAGVLRPTTLPSPASGPAYELTPRGRELEPVGQPGGTGGRPARHDRRRLRRRAVHRVRPRSDPRPRPGRRAGRRWRGPRRRGARRAVPPPSWRGRAARRTDRGVRG